MSAPTPSSGTTRRRRAVRTAAARRLLTGPAPGRRPLATPRPGAAATGPDPTLIVGTLPSAADPSTTGNVVQAFDTATGRRHRHARRRGHRPVGDRDHARRHHGVRGQPGVGDGDARHHLVGQHRDQPVHARRQLRRTRPGHPARGGGGQPGRHPGARRQLGRELGEPGRSRRWPPQSGQHGHRHDRRDLAVQRSRRHRHQPERSRPRGWPTTRAATSCPSTWPTTTVGSPITLGAGTDPSALAITPDGSHLFVTDSGTGQVSDVTVSSGSVDTFALEPTGTGVVPWALAITPNGTTAWVTDEGNGLLVPVTISTDTAGAPSRSARSRSRSSSAPTAPRPTSPTSWPIRSPSSTSWPARRLSPRRSEPTATRAPSPSRPTRPPWRRSASRPAPPARRPPSTRAPRTRCPPAGPSVTRGTSATARRR